jgi:hypothetical protein
MYTAFHQEIARSRQADLLREARLAHIPAELKAEKTGPGLLERLTVRLPLRRLHFPAFGLAR